MESESTSGKKTIDFDYFLSLVSIVSDIMKRLRNGYHELTLISRKTAILKFQRLHFW